MNNENKPSVIAELTAALASMAERAAAAEAEARSRRSSRESTLLSADMKTAPVFSLESSRNTSRQSRTRQPRQNTATAFSPALW